MIQTAVRLFGAIPLVVVGALLTGCGDSASARADSPATAFEQAMNADIAGDRDHLWAVVVGRDSREGAIGARVYEMRSAGGGWRQLPPIEQAVDTTLPLSAVALNGRPCAGMGTGSRSRPSAVVCLEGTSWRDIAAGSPVSRSQLIQLVRHRDSLLALVSPRGASAAVQRSRRTLHDVYRWDGERWKRLGDRLTSSSGIAQLGASDDGASLPQIVIEETGSKPPTRRVYAFGSGRWRQSGTTLTARTVGPTTSGPITADGKTWLAVNEANVTPWRFSVFNRRGSTGAWRLAAGGPLNETSGHAQGSIAPAGGHVWAIWVEDTPHPGRFPFKERVFAARIDDHLRPIELHSGASIGPGDLRIATGAGATWAMYMATAPNGTLQTRVRRLPVSGG
jgi:hypothetical protein